MQQARASETLRPAPRAILLDALGTLLALDPPGPELRVQLAQRFDVEVSAEDADRAIKAEIAYYRAHLDDGRDSAGLQELRRRCAQIVKYALPPLADIELPAVTETLLASLRFRVFDDVVPALSSFRARGIPLVVVSNWDVSLHDLLQQLGLSALLSGVVTSAEAGQRKPAPSIFSRALALAGASGQSALHVGDSPEEDVEGARAAGIEPVLIRRTGGFGESGLVPGTLVIESLSELDGVWA